MNRFFAKIFFILLVLCIVQQASAQTGNRYKKFLFGVDYYPEHWAETMWEQDARRMKECGVNAVRIGEFAWTIMEREEGKFDFDLFDRAIATLAKYDIKVIFGTPTATPPKWLTHKYPEVLYAFDDRRLANDQSRRHYNYNSPVYRKYSRKIVEELAKHYKDNPNIIGWQIDNEFNNENPEAWSESDRTAFRVWLKNKYKNLDDLNERWGTIVWSQIYTDWEQIDLPFKTTSLHNPSLMLDYRRFISDSVESYMQEQIDILRKYRPDDFITQNGAFKNINYYKFSRNTDLHSSANYPLFSDNPQYSIGSSLTFHRSVTGKFMIMEQQTGAGGQTYLLRRPRPGEMRLWTMQSIAHGADGIVHFRWRTARKGIEEYWEGVLDQDDVPRARYEDFKREGAEIAKISSEIFDSKINSEIAVIKDYDNEWTYAHQYLTDEVHTGWAYNDLFRAASEQKFNIDFIPPSQDFSRYKIIFAPYQIIMDEQLAAKMKSFVAGGGTLIMTAHSAVKNRDNTYTSQTLPIMGMRELFGVEIDSFQTYQPPSKDKNAIRFTDNTLIPVNVFADMLKTKGAKVIAAWDKDFLKGIPAVTENVFGKGKAIYYGSFLNEDAARYLLRRYTVDRQIKPMFTGFPAEIEVARRTKGKTNYYFILNHKNESVILRIGGGFYDLINGKNAMQTINLQPFGYTVLSKTDQ